MSTNCYYCCCWFPLRELTLLTCSCITDWLARSRLGESVFLYHIELQAILTSSKYQPKTSKAQSASVKVTYNACISLWAWGVTMCRWASERWGERAVEGNPARIISGGRSIDNEHITELFRAHCSHRNKTSLQWKTLTPIWNRPD